MTSAAATPITFVIPGQRAATRGAAPGPLPAGLTQGTVKESVRVGANRDAGLVRATAVPGRDVVVLSIADGPELVLHPETARDLLLAQHGQTKRGAREAGGEEVLVPSTLRWPTPDAATGAARSAVGDFVGGIVVKAVDVVSNVADAVVDMFKDKAAEVLVTELARRVDEQVLEGVYRLETSKLTPLKGQTPLTRVDARSGNKPLLVFVHGTFSNTSAAFDKLWTENASSVRRIFKEYPDAVYALDHATLTASPIANAVTLATSLPRGAVLHLVTHSRGGLVAEVLARMCAQRTITKAELARFNSDQRFELEALARLVEENDLHVERVVRVACPARGTLLASKRVDAYLSVFKWTLQLAGVPVLPALVDFLSSMAQHRLDADKLPGLEAQVPNSPLIQWLHANTAPIPGQLRVVAGDVEGDSVTSWLKTLLSDGFYWTDNDFVVQTRSMYGGARREDGATFLLDHGGKVSHTAYFAKSRAAERVVDAILEKDPGFRIVGPLSWKGESSAGDRATVASDATPPSDKPAVFVIPGFAGSRLKKDGTIIWPGSLSLDSVEQLRYKEESRDIEAEGFVGNAFDALIAHLSQTHFVVPFPYDWRLRLEEEAERLAGAITKELDARLLNRQPVRILAHSSGGLLVRVMQLVSPIVWDRFMTVSGARIVMLAPPNAGFWTPMQILSGDETFGGLLTAGAPPFGEASVREAMGTMPGLLQLQTGLLDPRYQLGEHARWQALAAGDLAAEKTKHSWHTQPLQQKTYEWGLPTPDALGRAVALRKRLDEQAQAILPKYAPRISVVVGTAGATTDGFATAADVFAYLDFPGRGDGRVTTESARLPGVRTWSVDCDHATLPSHRDAFRGYADLLGQETTEELPVLAARDVASRGVESATRPTPSRPSRQIGDRLPEAENDLLSTRSAHRERDTAPSGRALHVRVVNGDLMFVRQPLLLGHYRSMKLTGTEFVMDELVGGVMSRALMIGSYPEAPGTNQVFVNTHVPGHDATAIPRPEAVVVVGLGEEGKLNASALVRTVRRGVVAWAQRAAEARDGVPATFDLAATLIGSGGKGMSVAQSAQLIAEAVRDADGLLEAASLPRVAELQIIELYLDRATEAWRALQLQAETVHGQYVVADRITIGSGALRRPLESNYRGADYDFISVLPQQAEGRKGLVFSLDTKRARTEVTTQSTQMPLLTEILNASNAVTAPADVGRTLFNVLVPLEIEPFLGGSTEMVIEVDGGTAGIPWELLDTNTGARAGSEPWAIRSKLVRKLRTADSRQRVDATADDHVLVIGEPHCDPAKYLRLPGAREEANAVHECLSAELDARLVTPLISPDDDRPGPSSVAVLSALYKHPWRIVHIAGHGEASTGSRLGGVVLSPSGPDNAETFLSHIEIRSMRVVPELVFVNCCHIAARERLQLLAPDSPFCHRYDRPAFAAGLAGELIAIGVRCVIAAGWAVDDVAAMAFATVFYGELLKGERFIEAAAAARKAAWRLGGNTWAAYQCYGDPEWTFRRKVSDSQRPVQTGWDRALAGVASPQSLTLVLDTLATKAKFEKMRDRDEGGLTDLREAVAELERRFGASWGNMGSVADTFGNALAEIGDLKEAVTWYDRAVADSTAPLRAVEQAANLRARHAWEDVEPLAAASVDSPERAERLRAAAAAIDQSIASLETLAQLQNTMERQNLIASAFKRLAMVRAAARDNEGERTAIEEMGKHYASGEDLGRQQKRADTFYSAQNRLTAALAQYAGDPGWRGLDRDALDTVKRGITAKLRDDPDFWSAVGEIELEMFEALASRGLAAACDALVEKFEALGERVPARRKWKSVFDNSTFLLDIYQRRVTDAPAVDPRLVDAGTAEARSATALLVVLRRLAGAPAIEAADPGGANAAVV